MFLNTRPMLYPEVGLESYVTLMSCFNNGEIASGITGERFG